MNEQNSTQTWDMGGGGLKRTGMKGRSFLIFGPPVKVSIFRYMGPRMSRNSQKMTQNKCCCRWDMGCEIDGGKCMHHIL